MIEFSHEQISEEFKIRLALVEHKQDFACFNYHDYVDGGKIESHLIDSTFLTM